jgi:hypothetical protein
MDTFPTRMPASIQESPIYGRLSPFYLARTGNHFLYQVPVKDLLALTKRNLIDRWSGNRPPDVKRVKAIKKLSKKHGHMDGCLFFGYMVNYITDERSSSSSYFEDSSESLEKEHGPILCCYDGNHRRAAITETLGPILIAVMWEATPELVVEHFKIINMSVSVSIIYVDSTINKALKSLIISFVKKMSFK